MATISLKRKPFFYDAQIKRMLCQLMSVFAGYQVMTGNQRDGRRRFIDVPIIYGDHSHAVAYSMNGGSDNAMASLPIMSLYMTGLQQKAEWRQNPQHYETYHFIERARDPDGNPLVNIPGKRRTVERYMPVPYDLNFEVSMWASNNDQGYQLVEQICSVFNPDMDVMLSNSPADWIFLSTIIFQGQVNFEKAAANLGSGSNLNPYYVFTLPFQVWVWLSPPAKLYEPKVIREVHVPIKELEDAVDFDAMGDLDGFVVQATPEDIEKDESLT